MIKLITLGRSLLVVAGLACYGAYVPPAQAEGGGYEGLIAPPSLPDKDGDSGAPANSDEPSGYEGVVAGPVRKEQPPFTPIPGLDSSGDTTSLQTLSMLHGQDRNGDGVPDRLTQSKPIPSVGFQAHVKGKSAIEYTVAENIASAMASVNDPKLPLDVRSENAREAYEDLADLADGLRSKKGVPDRVYQRMGLSDSYIQQEKVGNSSALSALDRALSNLKQYQ